MGFLASPQAIHYGLLPKGEPKMITLDGLLPYAVYLPRSGEVHMEIAHLLPAGSLTFGTITHLFQC